MISKRFSNLNSPKWLTLLHHQYFHLTLNLIYQLNLHHNTINKTNTLQKAIHLRSRTQYEDPPNLVDAPLVMDGDGEGENVNER